MKDSKIEWTGDTANFGEGEGECEDPFFKFEQWCIDNGFSDVALCEVEDVNMTRLHLAIEAYGQSG